MKEGPCPTTRTASSTTRWERFGCRPTRSGARRPSAPSRISRSPGSRSSAALVRALALIKAEAARVNVGLREVPQVTKPVGDAIAAAAEMVADGRFDDALPDRRVPDRFRHLVEHERERGHRAAGVRRARRRGPPERSSERVAVVERRVPVGGAPRRRARRRRGPDPGVRATGEVAPQEAARVRQGREVGPHAPHGRHAGHARPGVRRLREPDRRRHRAPARHAAARLRASARRHRGGYRHQRAEAVRRSGSSPGWPNAPDCRSPKPKTTSPRRARATRSSSAAGSCARSARRCSRSRATSG